MVYKYMQKNGGHLHKAVSDSRPFSFLEAEVGVLQLPPTPPSLPTAASFPTPPTSGHPPQPPTTPQKSITHSSTPQHP